jgi:hypothetical protein
LSLILWEEGDEGPEGFCWVKDKILYINLPDASPRDPQERNETLICKKRGTHKNNDYECLKG